MDESLPTMFYNMLRSYIDADGFRIMPVIARKVDGHKIISAVIGLDGPNLLRFINGKYIQDDEIEEIVFAIDCFTKPGQGTRYNDVLNLFWWRRGHHEDNYGFVFGIVEYVPAKNKRNAIIDEINWNNDFWNNAMLTFLKFELYINSRSLK